MAREWSAELRAAYAARERGLIRAAFGAFADARSLRKIEHRTLGRTMMTWITTWGRELRVAIRALRRVPGFSLVAVASLALGIGGTTAVFTVLDRVVLDPLPYPQPDRLVRIDNHVPGVGADTRWAMSTAQYVHASDFARSLDLVGLHRSSSGTVQTPSGPERVRSVSVTSTMMDLLGARAELGRLITSADDTPEAPSVALLSHGFWTRVTGGDPDVIGRTLVYQDEPVEVIGVLAPDLRPPGWDERSPPDLWFPMAVDWAGPFANSHGYPMVARLADGYDAEAAEREFASFTPALIERFPNAYGQEFFDRYGFRTEVEPLHTDVVGDMGTNLWIIFGAGAFVLLIACANVANLFLVRLGARRQELAVRSALGARTTALARSVLAESLCLSATAGFVGLALALWSVPLLVRLAPEGLPRLVGASVGWEAALFAIGLSLLVGLGLAVHPVASQLGSASSRLAGSSRAATAGRERLRARSLLVVAQIALALTLAVGGLLMSETLSRLADVDPGVDPEGVLVMDVYASRARYETDLALWQLYERVLERVRALPGVTTAGFGYELPVEGGFGCTVQGFENSSVYERLRDAGLTTCAGQEYVTPGYFESLGIPVLEGRAFTAEDNHEPTRASVVVSKAFAERFWPGESAIGKGVAPSGRTEGPFYRVIGVVDDVPARASASQPPLGRVAHAVYYPIVHNPDTPGWWGWWWPGSLSLVVKTEGTEPTSLLAPVRTILAELDPQIPIGDPRTMEEVVAGATRRLEFIALLIRLLAGAALLLAAVGLYGMISYVVGRRTREIGMRLAIGARASEVRNLVVARSLQLTAVGLAVGVALALATTKVMRGLLFEVQPTDASALVSAVLIMAAVGIAASWVPAYRASRVQPVEALRYD